MMLSRLTPRHLPGFNDLRADLGGPDAKLARVLGVSRRTLARYRARDDAPRAVLVAMYWASRWGFAELNLHLHNEAVMYAGYCRCLVDEVARLEREVATLLRLGDFGSANSPSWRSQAASCLPAALAGGPAKQWVAPEAPSPADRAATA